MFRVVKERLDNGQIDFEYEPLRTEKQAKSFAKTMSVVAWETCKKNATHAISIIGPNGERIPYRPLTTDFDEYGRPRV